MSFFKLSLSRKDIYLSLLLAAAMLLTRSHHFGTAFSPPDASLAVFFLAGLWIASGSIFGGLLVVAALADQIAFASNVSDWCVTAAYGCLIPAYGAMWFGGKLCRDASLFSAPGFARLALSMIVSCAVYFVISSGSFFLLSGYFDGMSMSEYWSRTIKYFPWYLGWASAYAVSALIVAELVKMLAVKGTSGEAT
jgi:hypothetical protein